MQRNTFSAEHDAFREAVRKFVAREVTPNLAVWSEAGAVDRRFYKKAGAAGFLGLDLDPEFGGAGVRDYRFNAIIAEEFCRAGAASVAMCLCGFNDLVSPYLDRLCTVAQKRRWWPRLIQGEKVAAIAMTEPGTGSDLRAIATRARREGAHFRINGAKTLISNGMLADVVVMVVATGDASGREGLSLLLVETDRPGFQKGKPLSKMGLRAQDTAEFFLEDVLVPVGNLLGEEGRGLSYLMSNLPQERLAVAVMALASTRRMLEQTLEYVRQRMAFGRRIGDFQNTRFVLAEIATETEIAQCFVDRCMAELSLGTLSPTDAAMAKWWVTELQQRAAYRCVQLHGGYGYIMDYPIAQDALDARASTLYAGTTEIMKEIIGRSILEAQE